MNGVKEDVQTEDVDDIEDDHIRLWILCEKQRYWCLGCLQDNDDYDSQNDVENDSESGESFCLGDEL